MFKDYLKASVASFVVGLSCMAGWAAWSLSKLPLDDYETFVQVHAAHLTDKVILLKLAVVFVDFGFWFLAAPVAFSLGLVKLRQLSNHRPKLYHVYCALSSFACSLAAVCLLNAGLAIIVNTEWRDHSLLISAIRICTTAGVFTLYDGLYGFLIGCLAFLLWFESEQPEFA